MIPTTTAFKAALSATPRRLGWLGKFVFANGTTVRAAQVRNNETALDIIFDDGDGDALWSADKTFIVSPLESKGNGAVPDGEITAPTRISASYDDEDVYIGTFEGMEITLYIVDYSDPSIGHIQKGPFKVSEVDYDDRGRIASFEIRGISQEAKQLQVEELSVSCRSNLGDARPGFCKLPLYPDDVERETAYAVGDYVRVADSGDYGNRMFVCTTAGTTDASAPAYDYTVGNETTDGTAVFEAEEAWVRSGVVATATDNGDFTITVTESRKVDDWFANGTVHWVSGDNVGFDQHVRKYTASSNRVQMWWAFPFAVQVGDTFEIMPGCDKRFATCKDRFANSINFRAEHQLPGRDFLAGAGQ